MRREAVEVINFQEVSPSEALHIEPLEVTSVDDMLATDPPPRQWIVSERLPLGVVGILAAAGGTGKSMAVLQLAVSVPTGRPWLGMEIETIGQVLIVSAEDDRTEIHRRLRAITDIMEHEGELSGLDREAIGDRLYVLDRVGADNRLTTRIERETLRTGLPDRIIETAKSLSEVVLIVLDPLARFDGGDPNDNADATRLIEAVEYIRRETGATVLAPHHVSKAGIRDPGSGQEAVRGGSGLVDGARWVGLLSTLRRDQAKYYGVDPDETSRYVRFATVKANGAAPWPGMWLQRLPGGVLAPVELGSRQERRADDRYSELLPKLVGVVRENQDKGTPLTRTRLRNFAGKAGLFGVGDQTLRGILERALAEGHIVEHESDRAAHKELRTWR